jgi:hypothetical protein
MNDIRPSALCLGRSLEIPRLTVISRVCSSRVNLIALVMRFCVVSLGSAPVGCGAHNQYLQHPGRVKRDIIDVRFFARILDVELEINASCSRLDFKHLDRVSCDRIQLNVDGRHDKKSRVQLRHGKYIYRPSILFIGRHTRYEL